MVTFPNAKINLGLDIVERRADGYHNISTVMMPIPWKDILEIVPSKGANDTLSVSGRTVDCPPEKNLVMRAVKALREDYVFPAVDVYLQKIIPDGAGLGGGSADAAFTLTTLNSMFNLNIEKATLAAIAARLGADCPFFIYNTAMLCEGIGDRMTPITTTLQSGRYTLAVVKPPVSVPTRDAYAAVTPKVPDVSLAQLLTSLPVERWQGVVKNDFEPSVFAKYPAVAQLKDELIKMGAVYASMSGSGSSVFALFLNDNMTDEVKLRFSQCDVMVSAL